MVVRCMVTLFIATILNGHTVASSAPEVVSPPVAPIPVTVDPSRSDPPPPPRVVPEGEPLPVGPPAPPQPIPDPTIQIRQGLPENTCDR
jgi:hypothetical protein